jgi:hypothetical protein
MFWFKRRRPASPWGGMQITGSCAPEEGLQGRSGKQLPKYRSIKKILERAD